MSNNLLPNGLTDLLPDIAEKEADAIHSLMMFFKSEGYARVKPPLIEFEDTLLDGLGQSTSQHMFRMMDPKSQKMMGLRADITPQIARIAATRYTVDDYPLRFAYAGDVLHVKGTQLDPTRQFTQVGCEIIGEDTAQIDIEAIIMSVRALQKVSDSDITLDITLPALLRNIINVGENKALFKALDNKNKEEILENAGNYRDLLIALISMTGDLQKDIEILEKLSLPSEAKTEIDRLLKVVQGVQKELSKEKAGSVTLTIDPTEHSFFDYHRGISFTLYIKGIREIVGRGGRYYFESQQGTQSAMGFSIYMNALRNFY